MREDTSDGKRPIPQSTRRSNDEGACSMPSRRERRASRRMRPCGQIPGPGDLARRPLIHAKGVDMNIRRILAGSVPAAALMLTSQGASAFGMMEVGDWQVEFGGNVNAYLTQANCDPGDG